MKQFKKVCADDKLIVALNADKEKYLNYEETTSDNTIGNVCMHFHETDQL